MKPEDILFNGWYYFITNPNKTKKLFQVKRIYKNCVMDKNRTFMPLIHIQPIPITPAILEKNGFVLQDYSEDFMSGKWWTRDDFVIPESMIDSVGRNNFNYKYVHQLQFALRLCGIEKTIEL